MGKILREYWFVIALAILVLGNVSGIGYLILFQGRGNIQTNTASNSRTRTVINPEVTSDLNLTTSPTASTSLPLKSDSRKIIPTQKGLPQGRLLCDLQIPPAPDSFGTLKINASWSNITVNKIGKSQATVCVTSNGQSPALMSIDNVMTGTREITANWIAPNASYIFTLYDSHGGDLGNCGGTVIQSCTINTPQPTVMSPTPKR